MEILPNWHPIFVHFTVALFSVSVGFYILAYLSQQCGSSLSKIRVEFEVVARWCLWVAAIMTIGTVVAGLDAYYTVAHDADSHAAMTIHRNWALPTACMIYLVAAWSVWRYFKNTKLSAVYLMVLLIIQVFLLTTAWYGAEVVYRYGTGVLSLPDSAKEGHDHGAASSGSDDHSKGNQAADSSTSGDHGNEDQATSSSDLEGNGNADQATSSSDSKGNGNENQATNSSDSDEHDSGNHSH
tara:strand:+ start:1981 stop:2700 length:720 start_codon:yes stop_codon:yes gene_type:complete